ncbi:TPM domain-containing protein [Sporomusa sphaeroides DSM 2875]|uniref:TPM domain-containing protein n=1 Tax=Sporomusa sphaeroides TaxID=47679 RepID=UPI00202F0466|nr:TPM domain-containing protein [Sporomusa sphaeroides]MCM0759529.1 TPM domain-containing protein [Sporomusa sphaeroides DSM 2875]
MRKLLVWFILAISLAVNAAASAQSTIPPAPVSSRYVQDYAGVLSDETKAKINKLGRKIAETTKSQVVVVTVNSLEGMPIEEYALGILRKWGIGDKTQNNGVLLLIAVNDKQSRIEVGYGLEGVLNDAKAGRILDESVLSYFQQGDYNRGVWTGYKALVSTISGEYGKDVRANEKNKATDASLGVATWWNGLPGWLQLIAFIGVAALVAGDWLFFGGSITLLLLSFLRFRGGGGGGYGGGSGGGGGADRKW